MVAVGTLLLVLPLLAFSTAQSSPTTYSMVLTSSSSTYLPGETIQIYGAISPAPGPYTGALVRVVSPSGATVLLGEADVNPVNGSFSFTGVAGGTASWTQGVYTINATWGAYSPPIICTRPFGYGTAVTASTSCVNPGTTSSTSTSSSQVTSSSSSTSSANTTTTTSNTTTVAVPEFQGTLIIPVFLAVLAASAMLLGMKKASAKS